MNILEKYQTQSLTLFDIFKYIEENSLKDFENQIFHHQLDFEKLPDNLQIFNFRFYQDYPQITPQKILDYLIFLTDYGFSFAKISKKGIFQIKPVFYYVLENNLVDLNIFADSNITKNYCRFRRILTNLNLADFKALLRYYQIDLHQSYTVKIFSDYVCSKAYLAGYCGEDGVFREKKHFLRKMSAENYFSMNVYDDLNTPIKKLNLFAFMDDPEIFNYLIEEGVDIYHNFREKYYRAKRIFKECIDYLDLNQLADEDVCNILICMIFSKYQDKHFQKLIKRFELIEYIDLEFHYHLLDLAMFDKKYFALFREVFRKFLNGTVKSTVKKGIVNKVNDKIVINNYVILDYLLEDFCQLVINDNCTLKQIEEYLELFLTLYPINFSGCQFSLEQIRFQEQSEFNKNGPEYKKTIGYLLLYIMYKLDSEEFEEGMKQFFESFQKIQDMKFESLMELEYDLEILRKWKNIEYFAFRACCLKAFEQKLSGGEFKELLEKI